MRLASILTGSACALIGLVGLVSVIIAMAEGKVEHGPQAIAAFSVFALMGAGMVRGLN